MQDRVLTADQINIYVNRINKLPGTYWIATKHQSTLKLVNAIRYVNNNHPNAQGYDRFVYWPDYKVAGTISNIVNVFRNAGINQVQVGTLYGMTNGQTGCYRRTAPLTEEVVQACAFDPLNPAHQALFGQLIQLDQENQEQMNQMITQRSQLREQLLQEGRTQFTGQERQQIKQQMQQQRQSQIASLPLGRIYGQQQNQQPYSRVTNELLNAGAYPGFTGGLAYHQQAAQARQQIGEQLSYIPPNAFPGYPGGQEFWNQTREFYGGDDY